MHNTLSPYKNKPTRQSLTQALTPSLTILIIIGGSDKILCLRLLLLFLLFSHQCLDFVTGLAAIQTLTTTL